MQEEEKQLEIENRLKNIIWTVCQDYTLEAKPDVETYLLSKPLALYDGIKQGAFAKYFKKEEMSAYLLKKIYLHASERALLRIAQLCIEAAVYRKVSRERPGVEEIARKAHEDVLELQFDKLDRSADGKLVNERMRAMLGGAQAVQPRMQRYLKILEDLEEARDTMDVIRATDRLYNEVADPYFERRSGSLEDVLAVSYEELAESDWREFLDDKLYQEGMEEYLKQIEERMTSLCEDEWKQKEDLRTDAPKIQIVSPEAMAKVHSYVERNFGKTYLAPLEEKRMNRQYCWGIHSDCSLHFTDGILHSCVGRNFQYEYALKQAAKNRHVYYDKHRIVKQNINVLTALLKKSSAMREQAQSELSDRGTLIPPLLWKVGRTRDARLFLREFPAQEQDFVVDILIDASGSQRCRQEEVALQAYILSASLSNAGIPHRMMSYCTFWDYTVLQRYREYDEPAEADERIFEFSTSSNNRDGLALAAAGDELMRRPEDGKILIVLSDGRPYDVILNRPNARNPKPYMGDYAVSETASTVRKMRGGGIKVLGVFVGEEQDLDAEKRIFGKDFAYIRDIGKFSDVVGRYLTKQLTENCT